MQHRPVLHDSNFGEKPYLPYVKKYNFSQNPGIANRDAFGTLSNIYDGAYLRK